MQRRRIKRAVGRPTRKPDADVLEIMMEKYNAADIVFVAKYKYTKLQDQNGQCCMSKKDKVASLTPE